MPILHDDFGEPKDEKILAMTLDQNAYMSATNQYHWVIGFLHDKAEEFAEVDGALYFGLPPRADQDLFADMELDEGETHALNEEIVNPCPLTEE
eukprot:1696899-Rhodomonas_salina.1